MERGKPRDQHLPRQARRRNAPPPESDPPPTSVSPSPSLLCAAKLCFRNRGGVRREHEGVGGLSDNPNRKGWVM
jgi:hypothetical protein